MEDGRMYETMHGCRRKVKEERIKVRMRVGEGKIERIERSNERRIGKEGSEWWRKRKKSKEEQGRYKKERHERQHKAKEGE